MRQIQIRPQGIGATSTTIDTTQHTSPTITSCFNRKIRTGRLARRARQNIHQTADRIRAIQGRANPPHDLDPTCRGDIEFIQRIVIEVTGGSDWNAILQKQVHGTRSKSLAYRRCMTLAIGDRDGYAGNLSQQLLWMRGSGEIDCTAINHAHR